MINLLHLTVVVLGYICTLIHVSSASSNLGKWMGGLAASPQSFDGGNQHRLASSSSFNDDAMYSIFARRGGSSDRGHDDGESVSAASAAATTTTTTAQSTTPMPMLRVAYQGEPGAYSEKATRELLGQKVIAVGRPNFEACFRAVVSSECDYACLPIENSLGGSIHENYDLMLRYDLTIVAEHEFRVNHCLLVKPGVKRQDIKYAISHPQALAQCDNFLRGLGITPIPTYDTAGSAKMISEGRTPNDKCTPENTAAIASELAATTYGLQCLDVGIEDDDTNYTRFLLLARKSVAQYMARTKAAKTSLVFTLPHSDSAGALYKAMACFSLRDIDCTKIESRPTSASLLNFLTFKSQQMGQKRGKGDIPRFRYCFYLDIIGSITDEHTQNALAQLREQADFVRILGSYPKKSRLVGPVAAAVEQMKHMVVDPDEVSLRELPSDSEDTAPLRIGIVGFDVVGQSLARHFAQKHKVRCLDSRDQSREAQKLNVEYYPSYETSNFLADLDVVVFAVSLIDFDETIQSIPVDELKGKLVVEMCALNVHPKLVMLGAFGNHPDIDILSTHPMFGPKRALASVSGDDGLIVSSPWNGRPFVYEKVRVSNAARCEQFLSIFEDARCQTVEMTAEQHDASVADADFVTHLTGRLLLDKQLLPPTPVASKEYAALEMVADAAVDDFDLFFGMFKFNDRSRDHLTKLRENLAKLERKLAAKEAYLAAKVEMKNTDRQRLIAETKLLLQEVARNGGVFANEDDAATGSSDDAK